MNRKEAGYLIIFSLFVIAASVVVSAFYGLTYPWVIPDWVSIAATVGLFGVASGIISLVASVFRR